MADQYSGVLTDERGKTMLALTFVLEGFGLTYQKEGDDLVFFRGPVADGAVCGRMAAAVLTPVALAAFEEAN